MCLKAGIGVGLLLLTGSSMAFNEMTLRLGALEGPGWRVEDIEARLSFDSDSGDGFRLQARNIRHPALPFPLKFLSLDCPRGLISDRKIECPAGRLTTTPGLLEPKTGTIGFKLQAEPERHRWRLLVPELKLTGGFARIDFEQVQSRWTLGIDAKALPLKAINSALRRWKQAPLPIDDASGEVVSSTRVSGDARGVKTLMTQTEVRQLTFERADGLQAGESLSLRASVNARSAGQGWDSSVDLKVLDGQLYVDPVFIDFKAFPLRLKGRVEGAVAERWIAKGLRVQWDGLLTAVIEELVTQADNPVAFESVINIEKLLLTNTYEYLLKPFIANGVATDLEFAGALGGTLSIRDGLPVAVDLKLDDVQISDLKGRLAMYDLYGPLRWNKSEPTSTDLKFSGGNVFAFDVGAASLDLAVSPDSVALAKPLSLPVFDGALVIDEFRYDYASPEQNWVFAGFLRPVSIDRIANALGWPRMDGQLTGMIPVVHGSKGDIEVDGTLLVRAFDGDLTVRNLAIEQPFGLVPRVHADIQLRDLDLAKLTRTFSFGHISGTLEGEIDQLELVNWVPQSFDARVATPADDTATHKISQRAVDNLSSIGGGMSGLFSRGFLSFIEEFSYARLGISCLLQNGVCRMDGVAPKGDGYLIVEGTSIPRIDVVGFARNVDWATLVERLRDVSLDNAPVIQ